MTRSMKREVIHCVRYLGYRITLCGLENVTSKLDLHTGSWQSWISKFSGQIACPSCEMQWKFEENKKVKAA